MMRLGRDMSLSGGDEGAVGLVDGECGGGWLGGADVAGDGGPGLGGYPELGLPVDPGGDGDLAGVGVGVPEPVRAGSAVCCRVVGGAGGGGQCCAGVVTEVELG